MAAVELGPQCNLQTVDLLSLVESAGTPEFLANSERVLGSVGGSLYQPRRRAVSAGGAPAHVPVASSGAVPPPVPRMILGLGDGNGGGSTAVPVLPEPSLVSLVLGLGDGNGDGRGKEKPRSYWNSSAMARTLERKRRTAPAPATQASQAALPAKTLGLDGHGCSTDAAMQRRP
ncbi:uncharacterized protein LOC121053851 [Oryza brachyantha]|nr:uncharacterized protein LOC121053851 [Oryza brachyantha]